MAFAVLGTGWCLGLMPAVAQAAGCQTGSLTFTSTGTEQCYLVPADVTGLSVTAVGAPGGAGDSDVVDGTAGGAGGFGALVSGRIAVTPGQTLYVEVGGAGGTASAGAGTAALGGFNGGASSGLGGPAGAGGGGGGASDLRTCSMSAASCPGGGGTFSSRLLVAPGGAGGAAGDAFGAGGSGGAGGVVGSAGEAGDPPGLGGGGGGGGQQAAGGAAGAAGLPCPSGLGASPGQAGALGMGGKGATSIGSAGGGGGGYYGGGGGGGGGCMMEGGAIGFAGSGGGGGGSSFGSAAATFAPDKAGTPLVTIGPLPPATEATPAAAFATTPQGEISGPQTVTVSNTGNSGLSLTGLTFAGADPGDFIVSSDGCLVPVAPGASCSLTVNFTPQAQGARTATLVIASNDPNGPASVSLSGTGGTPPQGPAGPQGRAGAQGLGGPAGTVLCLNTAIAHVLCSIEFAPGTFAFKSKTAAFKITHGRRVVAHGTLRVRRGRIASHTVRNLHHGRYTLIITSGSRVVLKRVFVV